MSSRVLLALVLLACAACSKPPPPPALERVTLQPVLPRDTPQSDVEGSRQARSRLVFDRRDAWTVPLGDALEMSASASTPLDGSFSVGLTGVDAEAKLEGQIRVVLEIEGEEGTSRSEASLDASDACARWTPLFVGKPGVVERVSIRGSWIGSETPSIAAAELAIAPERVRAPERASRERPNVVVVSIDTLRADRLGCYGHARATSPNLDALAAKGLVFERAFSPAPWTLPAYGSLFTGRLPAEHRAGVVTEREALFGEDGTPTKRTTEHLRDDVPTLAELLARAGWRTAGFSCNPFLGPGAGLDRGFERYVGYQYNAKGGVDRALEWLAAHEGERVFLFLHLIDPHYPFAPPDPYAQRFGSSELADAPPPLDELRRGAADDLRKQLSDLYDGEIAYADAELARLFARLEASGLSETTLVALHSDHGEELWDHGGFEHGHTQHAEVLHVPLVIAMPGRVPVGARVAHRVRSHDLFATILDVCGVEAPRGIDARSLLGTIEADRDALSEAILWGTREIKSLARGSEKLIVAGKSDQLLYDVARDPRELEERAALDPERAAALRTLLLEHHERTTKLAPNAKSLKLDAGARSRLGHLGYAGDD